MARITKSKFNSNDSYKADAFLNLKAVNGGVTKPIGKNGIALHNTNLVDAALIKAEALGVGFELVTQLTMVEDRSEGLIDFFDASEALEEFIEEFEPERSSNTEPADAYLNVGITNGSEVRRVGRRGIPLHLNVPFEAAIIEALNADKELNLTYNIHVVGDDSVKDEGDFTGFFK